MHNFLPYMHMPRKVQCCYSQGTMHTGLIIVCICLFSFLDLANAGQFPANSDQYMHFISPLNFEAIDGRIVVGAA